ncbi:MAG: hypothetical protein ABSH44_07290 [Bryobacteraceae bacterium]|jgi:uncharacterized protein involved in exopolysaccharide biosynthesis
MRQLIRWTARLYPAAWRERYGRELDALIEDIQPEWKDLFNVLLGALRMQMTTWNYLKMVAAVGLAGALVAGVFALRTQECYVSQAVMRITPAGRADSDRRKALDRLQQMALVILSRRSLGEMITRPALDLYQEDRKRMPLEDVVQNMRNKALRIQAVAVPDGGAPAFVISCEYPDKLKAQAVVRELVARFIEQNITTQRNREPSAAENLEVLDSPSLPERPSGPNRPMIVTVGLLGGAVLGLLAVLVWRGAARLSKSA